MQAGVMSDQQIANACKSEDNIQTFGENLVATVSTMSKPTEYSLD